VISITLPLAIYLSGSDPLVAQRARVECDVLKAKSAEDAAAKVKNWREMYGAFLLYEDCDDGRNKPYNLVRAIDTNGKVVLEKEMTSASRERV
jgi:hypothetical protein